MKSKTAFKNTLFKPMNYIHSNGDKEYVIVLGYDNRGMAWVKWKDGFINMISINRLQEIEDGKV